jgi:hypothetical protein
VQTYQPQTKYAPHAVSHLWTILKWIGGRIMTVNLTRLRSGMTLTLIVRGKEISEFEQFALENA